MDEEEIDRLLLELGLDVPDVAENADHHGLPPSLDDLEEWI